MESELVNVSTLQPIWAGCESPITGEMLKKRQKSRDNSPSPKKQSDVSEEDYQQISELMPTEESQKALYNLLTKRKNLQEVSDVADFVVDLRTCKTATLTPETKWKFQRLLVDIVPESLIDFQRLREVVIDITLDAVNNLRTSNSAASECLVEAMSNVFDVCEETESWGEFKQWPDRLVLNKIHNFIIKDINKVEVSQLNGLLGDLNALSEMTEQEKGFHQFLLQITAYCSLENPVKSLRESMEIFGEPNTPQTPTKDISVFDEFEDSPERREMFYSPTKYKMPRKKVASRNSTFMRMRQNQKGKTVKVNNVQSNSFRDFKEKVAHAEEVQGWPDVNISTWVDHDGNSTQVLTSPDFDTNKLELVGKYELRDGDGEKSRRSGSPYKAMPRERSMSPYASPCKV